MFLRISERKTCFHFCWKCFKIEKEKPRSQAGLFVELIAYYGIV
ncbi:hypothetical protein CES85_0321 [Ochrobactrum quorumnocens]|uniref:Uncharacterized protein n=1 Tax=Ochrobactrum quorumnocens TaxID=271865 RepID=A0A248UKK9_9HYPH|nr:hypothetical protein CES85_0321 [[Ochrobactrum] quorumnocens]